MCDLCHWIHLTARETCTCTVVILSPDTSPGFSWVYYNSLSDEENKQKEINIKRFRIALCNFTIEASIHFFGFRSQAINWHHYLSTKFHLAEPGFSQIISTCPRISCINLDGGVLSQAMSMKWIKLGKFYFELILIEWIPQWIVLSPKPTQKLLYLCIN